MADAVRYTLTLDHKVDRIFKSLKKKNPDLLRDAEARIIKILRSPDLGKPLRNMLRNRRRIQIGSFVLLYEIAGTEIRLLDFDHHDKVYKKRS
jgi:mRNA-degrading endonuclease RelE of RelBE toxin-antitoxin system